MVGVKYSDKEVQKAEIKTSVIPESVIVNGGLFY